MIRFLLRIHLIMLVLSAVAGFVTVLDLSAQEERLVPGARVRITAERWSWEQTEARLVGRDGDTLMLEREGAPEIRLSLADIERLEVNTLPDKRGSYALGGALIGVILGTVSAKLVLDAVGENDELNLLYAPVYGVPIGGLLGLGTGALLGSERWETVPLQAQAHVFLSPSSTSTVEVRVPLPIK